MVTGGGTGIGRATAIRLSESGYECLVVGRRKEKLDETVECITGRGGKAVPVPADITTVEGREKIFEVVDVQESCLSALVNNAGDSNLAPLFDQDLKKWQGNFSLNLESAAFLAFEAIERMSESGGAIVNVASVYGMVALNNRLYADRFPASSAEGPTRDVSYAASKGALRMLSRELAVAAAPMGVRVNTVSPGMIQVEKHEFESDYLRKFEEMTPMGRLGRPAEIAGAINFLLSPEASYITGSEIVVDGGWTVW
ncbi:SDR family NAD(P)-dependent oxidoreductase [Amycolatopsis acidicola]|uniref:SDR family NAD(P)-dependent oxidoreductase n=1 Tax=Amycolatopsis acidicola TaxID=2596893 RepID=UPI001FB820B9|nr:SDR family oxidoreductase [Amycolatopsis acidicola]